MDFYSWHVLADHAAVVGGLKLRVLKSTLVGVTNQGQTEGLRSLCPPHQATLWNAGDKTTCLLRIEIRVHLPYGVGTRHRHPHGFVTPYRGNHPVDNLLRHPRPRRIMQQQIRVIGLVNIGHNGVEARHIAFRAAIHNLCQLAPCIATYDGIHLATPVRMHHRRHLIDGRMGIECVNGIFYHSTVAKQHKLFRHRRPHTTAGTSRQHHCNILHFSLLYSIANRPHHTMAAPSCIHQAVPTRTAGARMRAFKI